jgi:hypothetical protein
VTGNRASGSAGPWAARAGSFQQLAVIIVDGVGVGLSHGGTQFKEKPTCISQSLDIGSQWNRRNRPSRAVILNERGDPRVLLVQLNKAAIQ